MRATFLWASREGRAAWLVAAIALGWALGVGWLAIRQYEAFSIVGNDLGVYAQVIWTTAHGRPFWGTLIQESPQFLGHHWVPALALLAPLYRLWPDARLLLVAQTVALATSLILLWLFARRRLAAPTALAIVVAFALTPLLAWVALAEFHEIALAVPLLLAAGAALLEQRWGWMALWLGLALGLKEEVALIAIGFGLYAGLVQRQPRVGLALTLGGAAWAAALLGWLMPALTETQGPYFFVWRYGALGDSPAAILRTVLTDPRAVAALLTTAAKRRFVWLLLAPLAGLPLLGLPVTLLALPTLAYLLLSSYELQVAIESHYAAPLLPFMMLGTVVALERLRGWHPTLERLGAVALLGCALWAFAIWSPLPGGGRFQPERYAVTSEERQVAALLRGVADEAHVAASWRYYPWLANRWRLHSVLEPSHLRQPHQPPDFVVDDAPAPDATSAPTLPWIVAEASLLGEGPLRQPRYRLQSEVGAMQLWARRAPAEDVPLARINVAWERGLTLVAAGVPPEAGGWREPLPARPGATLPLWLAWAAREPLAERLTFTVQLFDGAGRGLAQVDQELGRGRFPTTLWHTWMAEPVVTDEWLLSLPTDLPPGRYHLRAGVYKSATVTPLTRPDGTTWADLGTVEVR